MKITSLALVPFLLIGCSSSPSDSDVKKSLDKIFDGVCEIAKIENVKKINGVEAGPREYSIKASFDVVIAPRKGMRELAEEVKNKSDRYNVLVAEMQENQKSIESKFTSPREDIERQIRDLPRDENSIDIYNEKYPPLAAKIKELENSSKLEVDKNRSDYSEKIKSEGLDEISSIEKKLKYQAVSINVNECKVSGIGLKLMLGTMGGEASKAYAYGARSSFTYDFNMIKTDNGWQINL
jgi:flagellar biosynthesis GTPase FlhF